MSTLGEVGNLLWQGLTDWRNVRLGSVLFARQDVTLLTLVILLGLAVGVVMARTVFGRSAGRSQVGLPALLSWARPSPVAFVRHIPLGLSLIGLPFFMIALADPYTQLQRQEVTYPGRRIALMVDASSSMMAPFPAAQLNPTKPNANFFTTVGAAETFIRQRMKGPYRDLIALIEFGDQAYVVTPFTTDYDNILLSLSLVGDWTEFTKFPSAGTQIGVALEQSIALFAAFDFLDAAGNLMVIFSDGQDSDAIVHGQTIMNILSGARRVKVPVYFIRSSYGKGLGAVVPDQVWRPAVESTGGKFYPATDESTILQAISDIDRRAAGTIAIKRYSTGQPQYSPFVLIAVMLWAAALGLKFTVPYFRKFP